MPILVPDSKPTPVLVTFSVVNATKGLVFDVIKKQSQELKSETEAQPHTNS